MPSLVESELLEATGVSAKQDRAMHLQALMEATSELDDDSWRQLSTEAQEWFNAAVEANGKGEPLPELNEPGGDEELSEEGKVADEKQDEDDEGREANEANEERDERSRTAKRVKKAAKTIDSVRIPRRGARSFSGRTGEGGPNIIRRMMIKNPRITQAQLIEYLRKKGNEISPLTVSKIKSDTLTLLRMLDESGHLKGMKL